MALNITGPSSIAIPTGQSVVSQDYNSSKNPATWSVTVTNDGALSPGDYTVTISPSGNLIVTLLPGVVVPAGGTSMSLIVSASAGNGNGNNGSLGVTVSVLGGAVPSFVRGTLIRTSFGQVAVEHLRTGDIIRTLDQGDQPIRWIGHRKFDSIDLTINPNFRPIRIAQGALGNEMPTQDLLVSPQHRILVRSAIAKRMFGSDEVLIAAKKLLALDGINYAEDVETVEYFHFMFERHQIVFSNDAPTESMLAGAEALNALTGDAKAEIFAIFPELQASFCLPEPAAFIPVGRQQKQLVARHVKNGRSLIDDKKTAQ